MKHYKAIFLPVLSSVLLLYPESKATASCDISILRDARDKSSIVNIFSTSLLSNLRSATSGSPLIPATGATGIVILSESGTSYILTAQHTFPEFESPSSSVGSSTEYSYYIEDESGRRTDLIFEESLGVSYDAVLFRPNNPSHQFTSLPIGSASVLETGDTIMVAGFPGAGGQTARELELTCESGQFVGVSPSTRPGGLETDVLQYNIPLVNGPDIDSAGYNNPAERGRGISGGSVLDGNGQLVGMHLGPNRIEAQGEGLPISVLFNNPQLARFNFDYRLATQNQLDGNAEIEASVGESEVTEAHSDGALPNIAPLPNGSFNLQGGSENSFSVPGVISQGQENMGFIPVVGSSDLLILQDSSITTNTPITDRYYSSPTPEISQLSRPEINLLWQQSMHDCLQARPYLYSVSQDSLVSPLDLSSQSVQNLSIVANMRGSYVCSQIVRDRL